MSLYLGSTLLAGASTNTVYNANNLLDFKWTDYILNDQSWLRADTFSWNDGTVYSTAYNHLVADNSGGTSQTETVGSYTITYVLADDGHKITTDEATVANIYAESGAAWYYILDTVNTRFKLPRINPASEELTNLIQSPVKGNGMTLGWTADGPTAYGTFTSDSRAYTRTGTVAGTMLPESTSGAGGSQITVTNGYIGITTDGSKSGLIADLSNATKTSVYKGKKYLYFYVGNFSQSATEQTAGLNASLFNGKMDLDLTNIDNTNNVASTALNTAGIRTVVETYSNGYDWYRIYSDGWVEQGGNYNTALANNYYVTVAFLVPYRDTNYTITTCTTRISGTNSPADNKAPIISSLTKTNFQCSSRFENVFSFMWRAEGFKEEEQ